VIAGDYDGHRGPAQTFSPVNVWDVRHNAGCHARLALPAGHTAALVVLRGTVQVNGSQVARDAQMVMFDREGTDVVIDANTDATLLLLGGEPLNEPIVGRGPFVMNTMQEIHQAIADFSNGRFGRIPPQGSP